VPPAPTSLYYGSLFLHYCQDYLKYSLNYFEKNEDYLVSAESLERLAYIATQRVAIFC